MTSYLEITMKDKLTVTIDDETLEIMKELAEERGLTIVQLGEELLLEFIKEYKETHNVSTNI
jgi:phosphoribosylanthranilate isomerase